jgi:hypothetical protein
MAKVKLKRSDLQANKYKYTWNRDKGDGEYAGTQDRIRVDKDEGYEVLYFIQALMNKHSLRLKSDVHRIEDALHEPELSGIVIREKLDALIEAALSL